MIRLPRTLPLLALVGAGLLVGWASPVAPLQASWQFACAPNAPAVPSEYLAYHALVTPHAALVAPRDDAKACASRVRGVRT